jgi:pyochelin biosynthetic protein PchC
VCGLGGIERELAASAELRDLVLPALRADLRASESYAPAYEQRLLPCPVRCYHGLGDPLVSEADARTWAEVSSGSFTFVPRPGAHFHVASNTKGLVDDLLTTADHSHV